MLMSELPRTLSILSLIVGVAACGGGGSDVNVQVPANPSAPTPSPAPTPPSGGSAAWPVPAYEYWIPRDGADALGTTTVAPDRSVLISNIAVRFSAPFTSGCAIDNGSCAERFAAQALTVCPQNQPNVVLVDARAVKVADPAVVNGATFSAVFGCDNGTTATAAVSADGNFTVNANAVFEEGPLSAGVASGRFTVRALNTARGVRHVIVERRTDGFTAMFMQD